MKVFYTPVINGEYSKAAQRRMPDRKDSEAYATVEQMIGQDGIDALDRDGYVKVLDRWSDGRIKGCWTYQQDDL